ncbi:MAG: hypothetical protein HON90_02305 [Halobacteriovoraceae bacterium]|jgi:endonuclease/exonuclease/phosphatase family metal-dependent hydrolase|nr:hypothetical protein [Halobacteriovoraceae bacterium]
MCRKTKFTLLICLVLTIISCEKNPIITCKIKKNLETQNIERSHPTQEKKNVHVISYNILKNNLESKRDHIEKWNIRKFEIYKTLCLDNSCADKEKDELPDLIGMQEVSHEQLRSIKQQTKNLNLLEKKYCLISGKNRSNDEFNPIVVNKSRFEVITWDTFWYYSDKKIENFAPNYKKKFKESSYARIATWVHLRDKQTQQPLYFVNTHLTSKSAIGRVKQTQVLLRKIWDEKSFNLFIPKIIVGDFNASSISSAISLLETPKLDDNNEFILKSPQEKIVIPTEIKKQTMNLFPLKDILCSKEQISNSFRLPTCNLSSMNSETRLKPTKSSNKVSQPLNNPDLAQTNSRRIDYIFTSEYEDNNTLLNDKFKTISTYLKGNSTEYSSVTSYPSDHALVGAHLQLPRINIEKVNKASLKIKEPTRLNNTSHKHETSKSLTQNEFSNVLFDNELESIAMSFSYDHLVFKLQKLNANEKETISSLAPSFFSNNDITTLTSLLNTTNELCQEVISTDETNRINNIGFDVITNKLEYLLKSLEKSKRSQVLTLVEILFPNHMTPTISTCGNEDIHPSFINILYETINAN